MEERREKRTEWAQRDGQRAGKTIYMYNRRIREGTF